jgi:hypothetical protein
VTRTHRLSLPFLKITLQNRNWQGRRAWRDRFASDCILSHAVGSLYAMSGLHAGLFLDRNYPEEIEIRFEGMRISLIERVRQDE